MGQHGPEPSERLRRCPQPGLGKVALQVRADETGAPAHADFVVGGGDTVGKAALQPGAVQVGTRLERIESGQLVIGDSAGQRLRGLTKQCAGRRAQKQEMTALTPIAAALVDLPAQHAKEIRHPLYFVQDYETVALQVEVTASVREPCGVAGILQVEVQGVRILVCNLPGEGGLPHLAWPEEHHGGEGGQISPDECLVTSFDHNC